MSEIWVVEKKFGRDWRVDYRGAGWSPEVAKNAWCTGCGFSGEQWDALEASESVRVVKYVREKP